MRRSQKRIEGASNGRRGRVFEAREDLKRELKANTKACRALLILVNHEDLKRELKDYH